MPKRKPRRGPVPKEAIKFLEAKGLKPGFSYRDVWGDEHNDMFTVAKIMENDILSDVQLSLIDAMMTGQPYREWVKGIKGQFDKSGWSAYGTDRSTPHRLNVIYDTNIRGARSVGQWKRIQEVKQFRPFLRYALGPSENHRKQHELWEGIILPVDHPWWDAHTPQNGYLCKCHIIQETLRAVNRRGGASRRAPRREMVSVKNPRTGKVEQIPKGIDPGFNRNPGKQRTQHLAKLEKQSQAQLKSTRAAVKTANRVRKK